MVFAIYAKTIVRTIIIAVLFITLAGLAARFALYMWDDVKFLEPLRIFDVGEQRSIPTWFESILFLLCSILLAVVVIIVLLAYLRFLANLPQTTRRLFLFAGALFVLGALGIEMLTAQVVSSSGGIANWIVSSSGGIVDRGSASAIPTILKGLQTSVEEMFEMLGLSAFVYALLAYIRSYVEDISVRVRIDKSA